MATILWVAGHSRATQAGCAAQAQGGSACTARSVMGDVREGCMFPSASGACPGSVACCRPAHDAAGLGSLPAAAWLPVVARSHLWLSEGPTAAEAHLNLSCCPLQGVRLSVLNLEGLPRLRAHMHAQEGRRSCLTALQVPTPPSCLRKAEEHQPCLLYRCRSRRSSLFPIWLTLARSFALPSRAIQADKRSMCRPRRRWSN